MARIPQATPQGRPDLGPRFGVPSDQSAGVVGSAVSDLGTAITRKGREVQEKNDAFKFALAESSFLTADVESRAALEEDADWEGWSQKHETALRKAMDDAMSGIRDKRDRGMFQIKAEAQIARSMVEVEAMARVRQVDEGRASLSAALDSMQRTALETTDPATRARMVGTAGEMINAARDANIPLVTAEEAEQLRKEWVAEYATGAVSLMPDEEQMRILKKPAGSPAQYIAPEVRQEMFRAAESRNKVTKVRGAAIANTDKIIQKHPTLSGMKQALSEVSKIDNPDVQVATRQMVKERYAEMEAIKTDEHNRSLESVMNHVEEGQPIETIPPADWANLSAAERQGAENRLQDVLTDDERVTDEEAIMEWREMSARDKANMTGPALANQFKSRMDIDDWDRTMREWESYRDAAEGNEASIAAIREGNTQTQMIEDKLVSSGLFTKKPTASSGATLRKRYFTFEDHINKLVLAESTIKGRKLGSAEIESIIDREIIKQAFVPGTIWGGSQRLFINMTAEERAKARTPYDDIPPGDLLELTQRAERLFKRRPSNREVERAHAAALAGDFARADSILRGEQ